MPIETMLASFAAKQAAGLLLNATGKHLKERREAKILLAGEALLQQIAIVTQTEPEDAVAQVENILQEAGPDVEDTIFEHFQHWMDVLDPRACPHIARLTAWYVVDKRMRDVFFRRVGRMLVDAAPDEIEALQLMFSLAREAIGKESLGQGDVVRIEQGGPGGVLGTPVGTISAFITRGPFRPENFIGRVDRQGNASVGFDALKRAQLLPDRTQPEPHSPPWTEFDIRHHNVVTGLVRVFA